MPSKMVTDREKSCLLIETSVTRHSPVIAEGLVPVITPVLEEGETAPDVAQLMRVLGRLLALAREAMVAADEAHLNELDDDHEPRRRRDEAAEELYGSLIRVRGVINGIYGPRKANELVGIEGRTSQDPVVLARQTNRFLERIRDPELDLGRPVLPGVTLEVEAIVADLEPKLEVLNAAIEDVGIERREADQTLVRKQEAIAAYDRIFLLAARALEAFYRLADQDEFADRIRPSSRRPGRTRDQEENPEPLELLPHPETVAPAEETAE